jgi:hypothetical protein
LERLDEPNAADGAQALRHDVEQCAAARTKNRPRVTAGLAYCGGSWTAPPAGAWTALPPLDLGQFGRCLMGSSSVRRPWNWMGEALLQTAGGGGVDAADGRQGEVRRRRGKGGEAARRVRRRREVEGRRGEEKNHLDPKTQSMGHPWVITHQKPFHTPKTSHTPNCYTVQPKPNQIINKVNPLAPNLGNPTTKPTLLRAPLAGLLQRLHRLRKPKPCQRVAIKTSSGMKPLFLR